MKKPDIPKNEKERLGELLNYPILLEMDKADYDCLTDLAAKICRTEISLISLITEDKQWVISSEGIELHEIPREFSFCAHAINRPGKPLIIENALDDDRFADNPYVINTPDVRFYAGIPLVNENGYALGALCVIDKEPKKLTDQEINSLQMIAKQVIQLLEVKRKSRLLVEQNHKFSVMLDLFNESQRMSKLGSWELNVESGETYWSDEVYTIHEVEKTFDHNKENGIEFYHNDDRPVLIEALNKCIYMLEPFSVTCRFITARGNLKWVRATGRAKESNGKASIILGTFQDVTEEMDREERLKVERLRALSVISGTRAGTWEWNIQTGETIFNERWAEIVGYTLSELQPVSIQTWIKLAHPDDLAESDRKLKDCFEGKTEYYEHEARMRKKDGSWVWVLDRGKVFSHTKDGKPLMMYGTHQEITERKQAEEQLRISEQTFRGSFEYAAIGIALIGENGEWLKVNKKVCEIVGYSEQELRRLTFQEITHPEDLNTDLELLGELIQGKRDTYTMEKRYYHKSGDIVYIILAVSMVKDDNGRIRYFVSQIVDITPLKTAQIRLSETIANYQALSNAITQSAIIGTDLQFNITSFNKGAELMLGYTADEVIGKYTPEAFLVKEEMKELERELNKNRTPKVSGLEIFVVSAKNKLAETREMNFVHRKGGYIPVLLSVTSIISNDKVIGYLGVAADVTLIKKNENELRALLEITQSQNERLKNFAHIVAHNLRSHSGSIASLIDILGEEAPGIAANTFYKHLQSAAANLIETIENLTEVVRINLMSEEKTADVFLRHQAERAIDTVSIAAEKSNVEIINNIPPETVIKIIPAYMDSIMMNFITNAVKYSDPGKKSFIKIDCRKEGDYFVLTFEDNGLGMDLAKYGHQLFGMYKTFHKHKDSRGVGLFITKNQIEAMNGKIEVDSVPGEGTTFRIYLPAEQKQ